MTENPRPTRHLEHIEPSRVGTPIPGSTQAWASVSAGDTVTPDGPPADGEPGSPLAEAIGAGPDSSRSRVRAVVAGGVTLAVVALGVSGALALRGDRPNDVGDAPTVAGVVDLPVVAQDGQPSDDVAGLDQRVSEARTRLADAVEDGEAVHARAAARSATPSAALRSLRDALDAGAAALEARPPGGESPEARTTRYLETLDACRSAIVDAAAGIADFGSALSGPAAPWSGNGSEGPAGPAPDEGGATGGSGDGETTAGGAEGGGAGSTGGTGSTGGGTTTPTATAPPSTAEPTPGPSTDPTPEPTPDPTPSPTVSPTASPAPTGP